MLRRVQMQTVMEGVVDAVPNRIIHDKARQSPTLRKLSDAAERGWWRTTVASDDYGRFDADPEVCLAELFKLRPAGWTVAKMARVLDEWEAVGLIHRYAVDEKPGRVYGHMVTFLDHQRPRESKPKFPAPPCGGSPQLAAKCRESRQSAALIGRRETRDERREEKTSAPGAPAGVLESDTRPGASRNGQPPSESQRLVAVYSDLVAGHLGGRPPLLADADYGIVSQLVKKRGPEEVERLLRGFCRTGTKWSRENTAWDLKAFRASYNKLLALDAQGDL